MVKILQENSPAVLVSTTHSPTDFLTAATLKNADHRPLTGCRIGWVVVFPSGKDEVHFGVRMSIPVAIQPGNTWDAPAQGVSPEYARQGASAVAFFVAEVYLAGDKPWKADLVQVREQALRLAVRS